MFHTISELQTEPNSGSTHRTYVADIDHVRVEVRVWQNGPRIPAQFGAGKRGVTLEARCLPGVRHWSLPDSATLRKLVDAALAAESNGQVRNGPRWEVQNNVSRWVYRYPTT